MRIKVETEEKYYCLNPKKMIEIIKFLNFKEVKEKIEIDEYFTDIDSKFIKDRTCLRIRKTDNKKMEITYKGKSNSLLGQYCKLENNISCDIEEYDNFVNLFMSLGFYSYVTVEKQRLTFEKEDGNYKYSIMLDNLPEIGGFVEFEIISEKEDSKKEELKVALRKFIHNFNELNLKEETNPYRDVVASIIYKKKLYKKNLTDIYINLDSELVNLEKNFFRKYKEKISKETGINMKWGIYKRNKSINNVLIPFIDEYLDNLIFDNKTILVTTLLLSKLNYKKHYITNVHEMFFTHFLGKLNIKIEDVLYLEGDSLVQVLKKNHVDISSSLILSNKNLNEINSNLLIMINNEGNL